MINYALEVFIDWSGDGSYAGTGENVSARLRLQEGVMVERGKDQTSIFSPPRAGQVTLVLDNQSGDYSPENPASPLYGLVRPGKKMKVEARGETLWTGIIDDIIPNTGVLKQNVGIVGLGNLSRLVGRNLSTTLDEVTDTVHPITDLILDAFGLVGAGDSPGESVLSFWWADNQDAFQLLVSLLATEGCGAAIYENVLGQIVFEKRSHRTTATRSTVSQATFTDSEIVQDGLLYSPDWKDITNECTIPIVTRRVGPLQTIWELGERLVLGNNEVKVYTVHSGGDPFKGAMVPSPSPSDTVQTLTPSVTLTSGTYKLRFRDVTTAGTVAYNASAATIQAALQGLSTIGSGNMLCAGGPINASPVDCSFVGTFDGQDITDLIEVVESTLNAVSAPGAIDVTEEHAGDGILSERQALRPSAPLTGGGPFHIVVDLTPNAGGGTTANIAYTDTAATIQTRLRALTGCGSFVAAGGPLTSGLAVIVNMIYSDNLPMMVIGGTALTVSVPSATIAVTASITGGVPDYVLITGAVTFSLNRTSGASCTLTVTVGAAGATIDGLKMRAHIVGVFSREEVKNDNDTTDSITEFGVKPISPSVLPELNRDSAQEVANSFTEFYPDPRPSVAIRVINTSTALADDRIALEISDRITVNSARAFLNADFWIETIRHTFAANGLMYTDLGCEKAIQFTPDFLTGLKLWLKADAITGLINGASVATWEDSSGLSNNAAQATAANQPVYKTAILNGLPIVRFSYNTITPTSSDYLTLPNFMSGQPAVTVFWVAKINTDPPAINDRTGPPLGDLGSDAQSNHYPFTDGSIYEDAGSTVRKTVGNPSLSLASWRFVSIVSASAGWRFYLDGSLLFSTGTNTVGFGSSPLVGKSANYFDGDIAEIIVYNSALSDVDRGRVQTYLQGKYNL